MSNTEHAIHSLVIVPPQADELASEDTEARWREELSALGGPIRFFVAGREGDLSRASTDDCDVVVLDWSGEGDDDPAPMVRTRELAGFATIVAVVPASGHPRAKIASRLGAKVVVAHGARPLAESIQHVALSEQMISELRAVRERTRKSATRDSLTGLVDRVSLVEMLERTLANRERKGGGAALLMIDLDDFGRIDQRIGRPAADELLRRVAERIRKTTRRGDTAARIGGDEFALVLASPNDATAPVRAAERILASIREPLCIHGCDFELGASIGIAVAPGDGVGSDDLVRAAERALFHAKQEARGSHRHADRELGEAVARVVASEGDLRQQMLESEPALRLTPQWDLMSGELRAFHSGFESSGAAAICLGAEELLSTRRLARLRESLLAWHVRGVRALFEAVSAAPDAAFAAATRALVLDAGPVKFSAAEFARHASALLELRADLVDVASVDVAAVGPEPGREASPAAPAIEVEFALGPLEPADLDLLSTATRALRERQIGLVLRVDGLSASTIECLRSLPLTGLVIDEERVRRANDDETQRIVLAALVNVGAQLGLRVVAAGVDSVEVRDQLLELGCREMRGPLFGKSFDAEELRSGGSASCDPPEHALPVDLGR